MALRKILANRYTWTEVVSGVTRYYTGEKGQHWDFAAGEITKGEAEGALGAADGGAVAATLSYQTVTIPDNVRTQAAFVADVAALTSVQEATANGSDPATTQALANSLKIKYNALQADVAALHTTLLAVQDSLTATGTGPMAAS